MPRGGSLSSLLHRSAIGTRAWPITGLRVRSSPGSSGIGLVSWPISSPFTSLRISKASRRRRLSPRSSSTLLPCACSLTGWWWGLAVNPAHAVRGPKHVVRRGKTPVLTEDQARRLLESIDTSTPVGLRDRALIGVMVYTFARIGAAVALRVEDYYPAGKRWWLRLHEKGGKRHEMPVHHKLEQFLDEYLEAAGIRGDGKTPLFRSAAGKTGRLTGNPLHRVDAYQMIRRRTAE